MTVDTLLVAVGEEDTDRTGEIAETVRKIVEPPETRIVLTHVLSEAEFDRVSQAEEVDTPRERSGPFMITAISEVVTSESTIAEPMIEEPDTAREEAAEEIIEEKQVLEELGGELADDGIPYEVHGAIGDPAEEVVEQAENLDADFVVVGGRRQSAARKALFGSVSQEIIRTAPCPVISITEGAS